MKTMTVGFTIIETLIGITLLVVILGGILGAFIIVQEYFKDGVALINSQATARIVAEKLMRPIRHGESFVVSADGNSLELDDGEVTFTFDNGDGNDTTFNDNIIEKTENSVTTTIGTNIVKIPDKNVFQQGDTDKLVEINIGVKNEGTSGCYKEVHISTEVNLRN